MGYYPATQQNTRRSARRVLVYACSRGSAELVGGDEHRRLELADRLGAEPHPGRLAVDPHGALLQVGLECALVHADLLEAHATLAFGRTLADAGGLASGSLACNCADARHGVLLKLVTRRLDRLLAAPAWFAASPRRRT